MLIEKSLFTKSECEFILNQVGDFTNSVISYDGGKTYSENKRKRKSQEAFIKRENVIDIILPKLKEYGIVSLPTIIKVVKYNVGSFFLPHKDRAGGGTEKRRKTLLVQLSEGSDYEGAELSVKNTIVPKEIGTTVLFDSTTLHGVTKLTSGERNALVIWFQEDNIKSNKNIL